MKKSLAETLKAETQAHHGMAERAGLMRELLHGRIERRSYCCLLRNLYEMYATLESALHRHSSHAFIAPVFFPELFRTTALQADLRELHGDRWIDGLRVTGTTLQYVSRLNEIEALRPDLLVAHAYVRYLGDLSGGQIVKRIVQEGLRLAPAVGTRFYEFGEPAEVATLARRFRLGLDSIATDSLVLADIVAEAQSSFEMHARLFEELLAANTTPHLVTSIVDRKGSHLPI